MLILSTFNDSLNAFLKNNALVLALVIVGLIIATLLLLAVFARKK